MCMFQEQKLIELLVCVYGEQPAHFIFDCIIQKINRFRQETPQSPELSQNDLVSEKDAIMITYGNFIEDGETPPLQTLAKFLDRYLNKHVSIVHILPFYPYSSDDGFSVIDYRAVNPDLGSWDDIHNLTKNYRLMFDAVINHISSKSDWFKGFVKNQEQFKEYFITNADSWDLSKVVRPRTSDLLTEVETSNEARKVWTTFSADQIDLNYANPNVFLEIIDLLLYYVRMGASVIRLDAIAYMWKESGTTCIHLSQTHQLIKVMRLVLEMTAPQTILITETNVPHQDNISYFGNIDRETGVGDEAHMVYQFPLASLVLHTLITGNSNQINQWVESLEDTGIFMNFIASHDGIGMMPAVGLISDEDIERIIAQVKSHQGLVSYKSNPDGTETVYELNTTLYDALNNPNQPNSSLDVARFMASQVIMLSLAGVPGIYFHSLLGSRNAHDYVKKTGRVRSINRKGFSLNELKQTLADPENIHCKVFNQYAHLLEVRSSEPAFHPQGKQSVHWVSKKVFALERQSPDGKSKILALINISPDEYALKLDLSLTNLITGHRFFDLIGGTEMRQQENCLVIALKPYQALWIKAED